MARIKFGDGFYVGGYIESIDASPLAETAAEQVGRLADASMTISGTFDEAPVSDEPIPFRYFTPPTRRGWWRGVEMIEYAGLVRKSAIQPDGSVELRAAGALTRTAHRFWLKWTANRWLKRRSRAR